jgi:hypothetical protein
MEQKPSRHTQSFNNLQHELKGSKLYVSYEQISYNISSGGYTWGIIRFIPEDGDINVKSLRIPGLKTLNSGLITNCII